MDVLASEVVGVFAHVERTDQYGAGSLQALDQRRIARGRRKVAVDLRSRAGRQALHVEQVLHRKGNACKRTDLFACGKRRIDGACSAYGTLGGHIGEGIEDRIVLPDPRQRGFGDGKCRDLACSDRLRDLRGGKSSRVCSHRGIKR